LAQNGDKMRTTIRLALLIAGAAGTALLVAVVGNVRPAPAASVVPQGFTQTNITAAKTFEYPHDMEFAPDGRLFVADQGGIVRIVNPDGTLSTFLDISSQVYQANSMGLLGITLDPQFATNRFVYLFYTAEATDTTPIHNRIVRVTANASGDSAVSGSEQLLLRLDDLLDNGLHNGGSIKFGVDGKLYASVGDTVGEAPHSLWTTSSARS
jgi:glucose/arabinose dehydrogenase